MRWTLTHGPRHENSETMRPFWLEGELDLVASESGRMEDLGAALLRVRKETVLSVLQLQKTEFCLELKCYGV